MKVKINHILITFLFALFCFTSCQDEISQIEDPNEQETIVPNSTLANLMSRTSANFGAADDILDGASCFSVELPVTIVFSDITIIIETQADLEELEDLLDDVNIDDDILDFVFPITIIFSDYSQIVIANEDEFQNFIDQCIDDETDVIECVDFVYPISFSVFNSSFNLVDTVVINDDEALYNFLNELENDENALIVSLNFPVTLVYANGETIEINSNEELANAIEAAEQNCDDEICNEDEVLLNLIECPWEVFLYTNNDLENLSGPYTFIFNEDGTMILEGVLEEPYTTTWELTETDAGLELNIASFYYYEAQFGNWRVVECDDDELKFEHLTVDGTGLFFEQDCEDDLDCSITDISSILQECPWDFSDGSGNFSNNQMIFHQDGVLQITEGDTTVAIGGAWDLSATDNGLIISFSELTAFQDTLEGDWLIIECNNDRIELVKGNQTLVLERNCQTNNQNLLDCYSLYVLSQECDTNNDGIATFVFETQSEQSQECIALYPLAMSSHPTYDDAVNNTNLLNIILTTPLELESQTIYVRVFSEVTQEFAIQELVITVETCNDDVFNCFGDFEIVECTQPNNVPVYNLNAGSIGLVDCTEPFTPSFHETLSDAENNVNPIDNTEAYGTLAAQVYLRIEAESGNVQIFNVYLNTIECNLFECFESFDAVIEVCDNGTDGPYDFNLTIAFANCTPSADSVAYYETLADADAAVNPISNPEVYTSINVNQTVYVRVEINNQFEVFPIQLSIINCNSGDCTEGDIDGILTECNWNITSYNGSDNLISYNFHFEQNSGIVVIYNDTITIDAGWSTSQTNDGVIIEFSNVAGPNIQAINGSWLVVECSAEQLVLHNVNDSNNEIVLDRSCE